MLVLARHPGQKVVFPGLGISVEVLRTSGNVTRLGIEAPSDVVILRDEILTGQSGSGIPGRPAGLPADQQEWREKLNSLVHRLQGFQRRLEAGGMPDSENQLTDLLAQLTDLEKLTTDAVVKSTAPRVMVVDDQDNERELLATCLRLAGIEVITAANGREAFDRLHEIEPPDLVLLDMRMPEVDGPTLLKAIRDDIRLQNLRVFAVSGSSRSEFGSSPLPLDGWFSKPVRIDALLQAVRKECTPSAVS